MPSSSDSNKILVSAPNRLFYDALKQEPELEVILWDMTDEAPVNKIDIVVPPYMKGIESLHRLEGIEVGLVQWLAIGYESVRGSLPAGIRFANAASVHESSTAELAVGLAVASLRGIGEAALDAKNAHWNHRFRRSLADSRVLLVGYGGVAKAIEARLAGFEVEITRVASSKRTEKNLAGDEVTVHAASELQQLLKVSNVVIISLPLNSSTLGLFDAATLASMPDKSLLINVGRGPVVDTDALTAELESGRLRAALDVVDPEPLPSDHPLWRAPGLLLTPHVGGNTTAMLPRVIKLVKRQAAHMLAGEELENIVFQ